MSGIQIIKSGTTVSAYLKLAGGVALSSSLVSVVDQSDNVSPLQLATASVAFVAPTNINVPAWTLGGIRSNFILNSFVSSAAFGPNVYKMIDNKYTINNTAVQTGTITGIFLNATETALNGITHNLMDLQVGGVSKFLVNKDGAIRLVQAAFTGKIYASTLGIIGDSIGLLLRDASESSFGRLQLGGITNLFPSIARSNNNVIICLADASAGAGLGVGMASATGIVASAILQADSTTKGFLMPRQTQAQILAIAAPANGLEIYNTDLAQPCFYDGLGWRKISHSLM
jgi:hypothetical protein